MFVSSHAGRRSDVQGLRAIAVLLVVIYHADTSWLTGGYVGVDIFFVISGFVITRMLLRELDQTGRIDFKTFYLRRVRRLLPALALMLSIVLAVGALIGPVGGQRVAARTGAAAALMNANHGLAFETQGGYFDVAAEVNAVLHTWSLAVEEQFYLLFPAVVAVAFVLHRRLGVIRGLVGIATLSFVLSWALSEGRPWVIPVGKYSQELAFYSAPTRAWEFAIGGLLVFARALGRRASVACAIAGAGMVLWSSVAFDANTVFPGVAALLPVIGAVTPDARLVIGGRRARAVPFPRLRRRAPGSGAVRIDGASRRRR
jgi:peptidoglycan/LPS O-acetylase OafA/YrhL